MRCWRLTGSQHGRSECKPPVPHPTPPPTVLPAWLLLLLSFVITLPCSLYESLICNEYVNELAGPSLLPEDPVARARARLLIDQVCVCVCVCMC